MYTYVSIFFTVLLHLFGEWLFFFTKPSFLSPLSFSQSLMVLAANLFVYAVTLWLIATPIVLLRRTFEHSKLKRFFEALTAAIPSFVFASMLYIVINNFTHTVLHFSVLTERGPLRYAFAAIFIGLFFYSKRVIRNIGKLSLVRRRVGTLFAASSAVLFFCGVLSIAKFSLASPYEVRLGALPSSKAKLSRLPNVLFVSTDAANANHMSLYGYPRKTTPFMESLAPQMLFIENVFSNANRSAGSLVSLFTGKRPSQTRVAAYPDLLRGADSFEHLPLILRKLGYQSLEMSVRDYADFSDLNMREAFHEANGRRLDGPLWRLAGSSRGVVNSMELFFAAKVFRRIEEMLLHAFGVVTIIPQYDQVRRVLTESGDLARLQTAIDFIAEHREPVFLHLHLLGTHGPVYYPKHRVFSAGKVQKTDRDVDFYDDAILEFDSLVSKLVSKLKELNEFEQSILILHTDHSAYFSLGERLPLMIRFPGGHPAGRISYNVDLLDVTPTILDYLGLEIPSWMRGKSLLGGELSRLRPLIAIADRYPQENYHNPNPPFYSFETAEAIICQRRYRLNLSRNTMVLADVQKHTAPCDEGELPTSEEVKRSLLDALRKDGINVSSLH